MFAQTPPHLLSQVGEESGVITLNCSFLAASLFLSTAQTIKHLKFYLFRGVKNIVLLIGL